LFAPACECFGAGFAAQATQYASRLALLCKNGRASLDTRSKNGYLKSLQITEGRSIPILVGNLDHTKVLVIKGQME
jgi:hypothetical protein